MKEFYIILLKRSVKKSSMYLLKVLIGYLYRLPVFQNTTVTHLV